MSNIGTIGLYPPTINTDTLVFVPSEQEQKYKVHFELSQFNLHSEYNIVQCTVNYQQGGVSAVNNQDDEANGRYRKTNTILMIKDNNITKDGTYSGSFDITTDDLSGGKWNNGSLYKIQMRIGQVKEEDLKEINNGYGQQDWLNTHNAEFSEWSTMVVIKPINPINVQITSLNYDSAGSGSANSETTKYFFGNILDFYGNLSDDDKREVLSTYRVKLYLRTIAEENLLEDSGLLYANDYNDFYYFRYTFHQELKEDEDYVVSFEFTTENGYKKKIEDLKLKCKYAGSKGLLTDLKVIVPDILDDLYGEQGITNRQLIENIYQSKNTSNEENDSIIEFPFDKFTTDLDNEEGRISIKICHTDNFGQIYSGNLMLVRTDNRSNYKHWEDIKIINLVQQDINDLDIIYDYTVESGIIYSYGLQEIILKGKDDRGVMEYNRSMVSGEIVYLPSAMTDGNTSALSNTPVIRDFEHSFLLGENGVQLKLKYDNEMNSLKINVNDTKIDTIGNQYPYILRNGDSYYKTFPINGLISFSMDDNALFATECDIYNEKANFTETIPKEDIVKQYYLYNKKKYGYDYETDNASNLGVVVDKNLWQYDYNYEHLFREKVLKFLTDGKPKLFKSATEGNIIVRLMDVNTSPKQELGRLISSFTSTAHEIAEANLKNCLNYKFYNLGQIIADFSIKETKFGQVVLNLPNDNNNQDIISAIVDKYTKTIDEEYEMSIEEIYDVTIEFNSIANTIDGYKIKLYDYDSHTTIRIAEYPGIYHFDKMIKFKPGRHKIEIENTEVEVIVNFLYKSSKTFKDEEYVDKITIKKRVGQIYQNVSQNNSIINLIKEKHEFTINTKIQKILQFTGINIEANPGSLFTIRDKGDEVDTIFEIGPTGNLTLANVFNIEDIKYYGPEESVDLLIDYYFVTEQIQYQKKKKTGE